MRSSHAIPAVAFAFVLAFCSAATFPVQANGQSAPGDSLQHYWALDAGSGTTAVDSAGSLDGTLALGPVWQPSSGRFLGALEFDGVDDRVDLGPADIAPGPGVTIALWMRADDFGVADARLISKSASTAEQDHYWMLSTINSTALRFRLRAGGSTTTLATGTGQFQAGQWYHVAATYDGATMRLYKNGALVASTAKTGTLATSGAVNASIGNQPSGAGNKAFDGFIDDVRIYNRALSAAEIGGMVPSPAAPKIVLFHGDSLDWGHLGVPQPWVNIPGRIEGVDAVDSLYYSVNGGAISQLNMGPDGFRLVDIGDFNVEIDHTSLNVGANNVVITVVDTGGVYGDTTVTVNYTDGASWNIPDTLSFSTASDITDEAYIIDGAWELVPGGVRTDSTAFGYDRLLVAGESTWKTNYEVLVPLTIHDFETSFPDNGCAIGVGFGWTGHDGAGQPRLGHPYQSIGFIRGLHASPYFQLMRNGDVGVVTTPATIDIGTRYMMRVRSDSASATTSLVRMRVWEDGTSEPPSWDLETTFTTRDGSVILIAHRADVTFGDAIIQPLGHVLQVATVGQGSVAVDPDLSVYPESTVVEITATPEAGWVFDSWSGGLTGTQNPDTLLMTSSTTVTATFTATGATVTADVVGNGSVVRSPSQPTYSFGDTVIVTAVPDAGWIFDSWSGGLSGSENPDTIVVASDTSVTATFGTEIVSDDFHYAVLDTSVWRWFDPVGDATLVFSGTNAIVDLPGGISHDLWSDCNCAPRLLQSAPDEDFQIEAAFESRGTRTYQSHGLIVQEDDDTYIRFDIVYWSGNPFLYAAYVDGGSVVAKINQEVTVNKPFLRVTRSGDTWTFAHSSLGISWTDAGSFSQALSVTEVGVSVINDFFTESETPAYVASVDYFFNSANPISPEDGGEPSAPTPPVVEVWHGDSQYATLGNPQRWYNVVGRVWDVDAIDSLRVTVNGGAEEELTLGPDGYRLVGVYDFNAEIPFSEFTSGANNVVITAVDTAGERTDHLVTVDYLPDVRWSMPDTLDFGAAGRVDDEAYVVDGRWLLTPDGARTDSSATGYDRLLAVGDTLWPTEYEVVTPVTIHASDLGAPGGIGIAVGWQGHEGSGQPRLAPPYQTIAFIRKVTTTPELQLLSTGEVIEDVALVPVVLGTRYLLKLRSESIGGGLSRASAKLWEDGSPEPAGWDVEADFASRPGSALLIAHKSDVTFGKTTVTPLPAFPRHDLDVIVAGNGLVEQSPLPDGGTGLYPDSTTVTLTAQPDSGWIFGGWTGALSGAANPDSILMVGDAAVNATFLQTATLLTGTIGGGSIAVSPDSSYVVGDTVVVSAIPDPGWSFAGWSGDLTGVQNPDSLVLVGDTTAIVASFTEDSYTFSTAIIGDGQILEQPDSVTYAWGDTVIVTAVPDTHWAFAGWSGGLSGLENPDTVVVVSDTSVTATFEQFAFVVARNTVGAGIIAAAPDSATYALGDTVVVSAIPDAGWSFSGWSGGLSGAESPDTIIVASDTSITATFTQDQYVVSTSVAGNGQIIEQPDSATYAWGDTVVVTAVPDTHWAFAGWSGGLSGLDNPDTIIVASDTSITATFEQVAFVVARNIAGSGIIVADPDSATYALGDTVVVSAIPDAGWSFSGWSGGLSGAENPDTIIVASDTSITATFTQDQYVVSTSVAGNGQILEQPDSATYAWGDTVVVTAVPDTHWAFAGWSGGLSGLVNPDTIIVASDTSITATFEQVAFVVTENTVGAGAVEADPDSVTYALGDTVIVTAVPDPGWGFAGWSDGLSGTENPDTIIVASDTSITATFEQVAFTVTRTTVGAGAILPVPFSATYALGDTVVVYAIPAPRWDFTGWSGGLSGEVSPDTIVIASDTSITATFEKVAFVINRVAIGSGVIQVTPNAATYAMGDTVTVTAIPEPGWSFVGWSGGLTGAENPDTIIVAADTSITATFVEAQTQYTLSTGVIGSGQVSVTPDQASYLYGDTVIVAAVPDTGWVFDTWSGALTGDENPDTLVITVDTTLSATFVPIQYAIDITTVGNGSVTRAPNQATYAFGDTVILTAVPDSAWSFKEWTGALTGAENPDTVVVDTVLAITATFDPTPTAIGATSTPRFVAVQQNFPNPFGLGTTIRYGLPAAERATLEVYDVRGRLVARHDLPQRGAGWHEYRFEARDNSGRPLASGVYFYRLKTPGAAVTRKMVITR